MSVHFCEQNTIEHSLIFPLTLEGADEYSLHPSNLKFKRRDCEEFRLKEVFILTEMDVHPYERCESVLSPRRCASGIRLPEKNGGRICLHFFGFTERKAMIKRSTIPPTLSPSSPSCFPPIKPTPPVDHVMAYDVCLGERWRMTSCIKPISMP
jgi:hypothetical protein